MSSRPVSRLVLRVLAPLLAAAALAAAAPAASASPILCPDGTGNGTFTLYDSANNYWDFDSQGAVEDGAHDQWDNFGFLHVNNSATQYDASSGTYPYQCELQADGRQLAMTELDSPVAGLKWSRKVYVPATGTPFGRWVDFLRNTTGAPINLPTVRFGGGLGSDASTTLQGDADGNKTIADPNTDAWMSTSDAFVAADHDPALAHIWDGTVAGAADHADHIYTTNTGTTVWTNGQDPFATYDNVTVPPNSTIAFMHLETQDPSSFDVLNSRAASLAGGNAGEVFRGLTAGELAQIQNWNTTDADGDGVANAADNCMLDANADQADLDKDGVGDVCDDDKDGDGVKNADEAARGTDPAKADTDGDGKNDNVDVCPAKAGSGDDGCPPFNSLPAPPVIDKTPPVLTVNASAKAKRAKFLKGVKASIGCNEACSVVAELAGSVKAAKISKTYNLLLARKALVSGTGSRSVTLKPNKKLVGKAKRFTVQLKVTVTDAAGNVSVKTVSIKVS